jgi:hypothetical protein
MKIVKKKSRKKQKTWNKHKQKKSFKKKL